MVEKLAAVKGGRKIRRREGRLIPKIGMKKKTFCFDNLKRACGNNNTVKLSMDSRETMMPKVETVAAEVPSSYPLAPRNDSSNLLTGPPGYSPVSRPIQQTIKDPNNTKSSSETRPKHTFGSMDLGDKISSGGSFTPHMVTVNPGEALEIDNTVS